MPKTIEDLARESDLTQRELREFACICAERAITQSCLAVDIPERADLLRCLTALRKNWGDSVKLRRIEDATSGVTTRLWTRLGIFSDGGNYGAVAYRFGFAINATTVAAGRKFLQSAIPAELTREDAVIAVSATEFWMQRALMPGRQSNDLYAELARESAYYKEAAKWALLKWSEYVRSIRRRRITIAPAVR